MFTCIWYVALGTPFEPDASKQPNNIKIRDFERVVFDKRIELYYKSVLLGHDIENTDVFDVLKVQSGIFCLVYNSVGTGSWGVDTMGSI